MTAVLPGGNNTFVPSHEASGKLIVDARNAIARRGLSASMLVKA